MLLPMKAQSLSTASKEGSGEVAQACLDAIQVRPQSKPETPSDKAKKGTGTLSRLIPLDVFVSFDSALRMQPSPTGSQDKGSVSLHLAQAWRLKRS
eukprot:2328248-Amphidinium_carterae.1